MMASFDARLGRLERLAVPTATRSCSAAELIVPNIIEFTVSDAYLGLALYPRQATLLKVMFCEASLLSTYDGTVALALGRVEG